MGNSKATWSATALNSPFFDRVIVGFDVRRFSSINKLCMTSWDESVRYEDFYVKFRDDISGMNIFSKYPESIPTFILPKDSIIIAFDLPRKYVNFLSSGLVSVPEPLPFEILDEKWRFMGFDIVDAITQTSALHGFDLSSSDWEKIKNSINLFVNENGLIDDINIALSGAIFFDKLISEHAPFTPCGVWLKSKDQG